MNNQNKTRKKIVDAIVGFGAMSLATAGIVYTGLLIYDDYDLPNQWPVHETIEALNLSGSAKADYVTKAVVEGHISDQEFVDETLDSLLSPSFVPLAGHGRDDRRVGVLEVLDLLGEIREVKEKCHFGDCDRIAYEAVAQGAVDRLVDRAQGYWNLQPRTKFTIFSAMDCIAFASNITRDHNLDSRLEVVKREVQMREQMLSEVEDLNYHFQAERFLQASDAFMAAGISDEGERYVQISLDCYERRVDEGINQLSEMHYDDMNTLANDASKALTVSQLYMDSRVDFFADNAIKVLSEMGQTAMRSDRMHLYSECMSRIGDIKSQIGEDAAAEQFYEIAKSHKPTMPRRRHR